MVPVMALSTFFLLLLLPMFLSYDRVDEVEENWRKSNFKIEPLHEVFIPSSIHDHPTMNLLEKELSCVIILLMLEVLEFQVIGCDFAQFTESGLTTGS